MTEIKALIQTCHVFDSENILLLPPEVLGNTDSSDDASVQALLNEQGEDLQTGSWMFPELNSTSPSLYCSTLRHLSVRLSPLETECSSIEAPAGLVCSSEEAHSIGIGVSPILLLSEFETLDKAPCSPFLLTNGRSLDHFPLPLEIGQIGSPLHTGLLSKEVLAASSPRPVNLQLCKENACSEESSTYLPNAPHFAYPICETAKMVDAKESFAVSLNADLLKSCRSSGCSEESSKYLPSAPHFAYPICETAKLVDAKESFTVSLNADLLKSCRSSGCPKRVRSKGLCKAHGGGRRCAVDGCSRSSQGGSLCISHGGGKRCKIDDCMKAAQSRGMCKAHGGGVRCKAHGCSKSSQGNGFCRAHGGGKRCSMSNCLKGAQRGGFCAGHGGSRYCQYPSCIKNDRGGGYCTMHGGGRKCGGTNCLKPARLKGFCIMHFNKNKLNGQPSSLGSLSQTSHSFFSPSEDKAHPSGGNSSAGKKAGSSGATQAVTA